MIHLVRGADIDRVWPLVAPGLKHAIDRCGGDLPVADLWAECLNNRAMLFAVSNGEAIKGASVWKFETWPSGSVFRCMSLYGARADEWMPELMKVVRDVATANGVDRVMFEGRKGWSRFKAFKTEKLREVRVLYEIRG